VREHLRKRKGLWIIKRLVEMKYNSGVKPTNNLIYSAALSILGAGLEDQLTGD
jgi:hypothetical protein